MNNVNNSPITRRSKASDPNVLASSLADNATSPDQFTGTDAQKVQQALDYAIANNKSIRFSRMYDITGSSLLINKPTSDRTILYLIGMGGGIKKTDAGYIFTTSNSYSGDVSSKGMKYSSVEGVVTKAWNGKGLGGIIRFSSVFDSYVNVDTVVDGGSSYVQSVRFLGCTITGGIGWAFEWDKSYDTSIADCTIEHRDSGIRNLVFTGNPDNDNLRIINNVIEGLTGKGMELGSAFAVVIQGNYMEGNTGGYFDFSKSLNYHNGLSIIGNSVQQSSDQITANTPAIDLGKMGNNGVQSSGNTATGVLYNLTSAGNGGRLISVGDISYNNNKVIGYTNALSELGRVNTDSATYSTYGRITQYLFTSSAVLFAAGEEKDITISTSLTFTTNAALLDTITPNLLPSGSTSVALLNWTVSGSNIIVHVKNNSTGSQNITARAVVLRIV